MSKKSDFAALDLISAFEEKKKSPDRIPLSEIHADPNQPRIFGREEVGDLVESIRRLGLIEPIILRKDRSKFIIVAGERRFRAAGLLGWKNIPAIITEATTDLCYEISLAENEKRKNLNPWEVGRAIQILRRDKKKTASEVSELLGYSERYIKQLSSIARLDQKAVFELIKGGADLSVKSLERVLRLKEGRGGEIISPHSAKLPVKISLSLKGLTPKARDSFL
ncbi:MAG: ParB/RepB/Spo0J family partition protein, partial [Leptospira sp.]|nr:ParB/RepB/Spo0J family partition protein [Leptospira sp.]